MYVSVSGLGAAPRSEAGRRGVVVVPLPRIFMRPGLGDAAFDARYQAAVDAAYQKFLDAGGGGSAPFADSPALFAIRNNFPNVASVDFCQSHPASVGCDEVRASLLKLGLTMPGPVVPVSYYSANPSAAITAPPPPGYVPPVTSGGYDVPGTTHATNPQADQAASVSIVNKTRSGNSFQVGDSWELTVHGSPNRPVSATVTQDGKNMGTAAFGSTDASGQLVVRGTMDPSTVGAWREMWTVGAGAAPVLTFSVTAAGADAGAGAGAAGAGSGGGGSNGGGGGAASTSSPSSSSIADFLSSTFDVFGFNVPMWAAGLAAGGALYLLNSGGGRKR